MKILNETKENEIKNVENIIRLFNEYISSNKNFKYNKTYLNDSIKEFYNVLKIFNSKKEIVEKFKSEIKKYKLLKDAYIVVDHFFVIENGEIKTLIEKLNEYKEDRIKDKILLKKKILERELELFKFYHMDKYNIIFKYYYFKDTGNDEVIESNQKYSINEDIDLKMVESLLKRMCCNGK